MARKKRAAAKKPVATKKLMATKKPLFTKKPMVTKKPVRKGAARPPQKTSKRPAKLSLYERLGGVYPIAAVVDDFVDRLMVDPRINANAKVDEAHHRVPPAGFKYLVTAQVC